MDYCIILAIIFSGRGDNLERFNNKSDVQDPDWVLPGILDPAPFLLPGSDFE